MKIANKNARQLVEKQHPFEGSNLFGQLFCVDPKDDTPGQYGYVVYSYGPHHPLLACVHVEGRDLWFANEDGYSQSTKRHMSQCRPDMYNKAIQMQWLSTGWMKRLVNGGFRELMSARVIEGVAA